MLIELFSSFPLFFLFSFYIQSSIEVFHLISSHWFIFARDKFFLALENRNIIANFQCISIFESLLSERKTEFFRNKFTKIFNNFRLPPSFDILFEIERNSSCLHQDLTSARVVPNKFRLFCVYLAEGCRLQGWLEGRGWPRKENYKSFDEACCVLKKKGHRRGRREGVDGVGSRRASSREIQLPLNKLIHCRRPSATFSMKQRSNNPLFLPSLEPLDTFHRLSFLFPLPFPHPFFPS